MYRKLIAVCLMVALMVITTIVPYAEAGFSASEIIGASAFDRTSDISSIQGILESKVVSQRLMDMGFSMDEIQQKLSALSDAQLHELALDLEQLTPGADLVNTVLGLAIIVLIVILVLDLTGQTAVIIK